MVEFIYNSAKEDHICIPFGYDLMWCFLMARQYLIFGNLIQTNSRIWDDDHKFVSHDIHVRTLNKRVFSLTIHFNKAQSFSLTNNEISGWDKSAENLLLKLNWRILLPNSHTFSLCDQIMIIITIQSTAINYNKYVITAACIFFRCVTTFSWIVLKPFKDRPKSMNNNFNNIFCLWKRSFLLGCYGRK